MGGVIIIFSTFVQNLFKEDIVVVVPCYHGKNYLRKYER